MALVRCQLYVHSFKVISKVSWPISFKFYVKHHQVGGKTTKGFWADRMGRQHIAPIDFYGKNC